MITALAHEVKIPLPSGDVELRGTLVVPTSARGIVVFAHGAGSSRLSPRNVAVADALRFSGTFGTLLFDLLTEDEDTDTRMRFDIDLLTGRLQSATAWLLSKPATADLGLGFFGASTGAAAALRAAASLGDRVAAVVSRGGRPDLAMEALPKVTAPTLLIVGGHDPKVAELNWEALQALSVDKKLEIVPGATHLFEEPGAMQQVSALAYDWFDRYL